MAYKNGKITKNIKGVDYDVYVKTSADQVVYDDVISVKQKIIELAKALENGNTGGSGITSTEVDVTSVVLLAAGAAVFVFLLFAILIMSFKIKFVEKWKI